MDIEEYLNEGLDIERGLDNEKESEGDNQEILQSKICDICYEEDKDIYFSEICENKHEMCQKCIIKWKIKCKKERMECECPFCRIPIRDDSFIEEEKVEVEESNRNVDIIEVVYSNNIGHQIFILFMNFVYYSMFFVFFYVLAFTKTTLFLKIILFFFMIVIMTSFCCKISQRNMSIIPI